MRYKHILSIVLFCSTFVQATLGQALLNHGMIYYQLSRTEKKTSNSAEDHLLLFAPNSAIHVTIAPNAASSTIFFAEFDSSRLTVLTCAKEDTTAYSFPLPFESFGVKDHFTIKQFPKKTKELLGFPCFRVSLRSKKGAPPFRIDAWVTDRIKSRYIPIVDYVDWGGLPLELTITDGSSDSSVVFSAKRIDALDDSLMTFYKSFVKEKAKVFSAPSNVNDLFEQFEAEMKSKKAFQADTSISLSVAFEPSWEKIDSSHLKLLLENKALFARCQILRESELTRANWNDKFENTLRDKVDFTVKLDAPNTPIETLSFKGKLAKQQVWNFKKQTFVDKHIYSKEENPYNFYPEDNLVELCRVFAVNNIECAAIVTTTKTNLKSVMESVEKMLASMAINGL